MELTDYQMLVKVFGEPSQEVRLHNSSTCSSSSSPCCHGDGFSVQWDHLGCGEFLEIWFESSGKFRKIVNP